MIQRNSSLLANFNFRTCSAVRYPLAVVAFTFLLLHILINDTVKDWDESTPRDVGRYIQPDRNTTLIFPSKLRPNVISPFDFVIFVTSDPKNIERRNAIRQSWGSVENQVSDLRTCVVFLLGITKDPQVSVCPQKPSNI
jgi:hypothetical protein